MWFLNHRSELEISPFLRSLNRTSEVSVKTFGTLFHLNFLSPRCFRCHSLLTEWAYFIEFGSHMTVVKCRVCLFVRLCVCQPRRPKWRQPSRFAVQTRTILVEMLHKCFSQFREIALPSSGPEDWMASKSDCNCEGMLVHHLILLPSVKLTEPGVSPYFARKSWMYQLECYFFSSFFLNTYFMIQFVASEFSVTAVFSRPAVQSAGKNAWNWETIADYPSFLAFEDKVEMKW